MPLPLAELCNDSLPRGELTPGDVDLNEREQPLVFHAHGAGMFLGHGIRASALPPHRIQMDDILDMPFESASFGAVLAWYSLPHMPPEARGLAFREFARVLKPKGPLLLGAFRGSQNVPFDHAITQAFYWSKKGLSDHLNSAGFQVIATHTRSPEGKRPHLAVITQLT